MHYVTLEYRSNNLNTYSEQYINSLLFSTTVCLACGHVLAHSHCNLWTNQYGLRLKLLAES